jgi:hypothetical protein
VFELRFAVASSRTAARTRSTSSQLLLKHIHAGRVARARRGVYLRSSICSIPCAIGRAIVATVPKCWFKNATAASRFAASQVVTNG